MQKYFDSVLLDSGMPAVGVSVLVTAFGGGAVTIYSDNGATPRTNPITTDANGYFEFYAADGRYTFQISGTGISPRTITDILLEDPADGNAVVFSTLTATGQVSLGGATNAESLRISAAPTNAVNRLQAIGTVTLGEPRLGTEGGDTDINYGIYAKGAGSIRFLTGGGTLEQFRVSHTASAANFYQITGAAAAGQPRLSASGSDTNISVRISGKGTGSVFLDNGGFTGFEALGGVTGGNWMQTVAAAAGTAPAFTATGTDTNVGVTYNSKGSAQHTFNNGNVAVNTLGNGLRVKEGSNGLQGTAVLVGGTVTVSNTNVTANSRIFAFCQTPGGTPGFLRISARTPATSFTILSSSGTDTSTVAYQIFEPA